MKLNVLNFGGVSVLRNWSCQIGKHRGTLATALVIGLQVVAVPQRAAVPAADARCDAQLSQSSPDTDLAGVLIHRDLRSGMIHERDTYVGGSIEAGIARGGSGLGLADFVMLHKASEALGLVASLGMGDRAGRVDVRFEGGVLTPLPIGRIGLYVTAVTARVPHEGSSFAKRAAAIWEIPVGRARIAPFVSIPLTDADFGNDPSAELKVVPAVGVAYAIDLGRCQCIGLQAHASYLDSDVRHVALSAKVAFRLANYLALLIGVSGDERPIGRNEIGAVTIGLRLGHWSELRNDARTRRVEPIFVPLTLDHPDRLDRE